MLKFLVLIYSSIVGFTSCLRYYQERIPNGHRVPHPCFSNTIWDGVGHQNSQGGGILNPFGEDFKANGFVWDECLCVADSDGDGLANGQELGDPFCTWSGQGLPSEIEDISHPGVCEPVDDAVCATRNTWTVCEPIEFQCDNVDNDPAVEEAHLKFQEHEIPNVETSYYCQAVEFDDTKEMHAIAMEPIIDNKDIVHHIDLHACSDPELSDYVKETYATPTACDVMTGCGGNLLAAWALGITGICIQDNVGMRVGKNGDTVAILRIHYHNPLLKEGETDTSGLLMYVTENLREHDAQIINAGQAYLEIPPRQEQFAADALCHSGCTSQFSEDIYLMFGAMHMHYLGTGGFSEIWRNGEKVETIMSQDFYDYNSPHIQYFEPPIQLRPGDEIRYTCNYQSRDRTSITYRGESATDEMCNIYLVYYPAQNLSRCSADGDLHSCKFRYAEKKEYVDMGDCDWGEYRPIYDQYYKPAILDNCDGTGELCLPGCADLIQWVLTNHTCLTGNARDATISKYDDEFMFAMHSCKEYPTSSPMVNITDSSHMAKNCTIRVDEELDPPLPSGESNGQPRTRPFTHILLIALATYLRAQ